MKYEIINPCDKAYIEAEFIVACIATVVSGQGQYGLRGGESVLHKAVGDDVYENTNRRNR